MPRPEEEEAGRLDNTPEEYPCQRQKEGRPLVRFPKENHQGAFKKTLASSKLLGKHISECTASATITRGPLTPLTPSKEMASSACLMGSEVHEV